MLYASPFSESNLSLEIGIIKQCSHSFEISEYIVEKIQFRSMELNRNQAQSKFRVLSHEKIFQCQFSKRILKFLFTLRLSEMILFLFLS
jgi:hypothetical protein